MTRRNLLSAIFAAPIAALAGSALFKKLFPADPVITIAPSYPAAYFAQQESNLRIVTRINFDMSTDRLIGFAMLQKGDTIRLDDDGPLYRLMEDPRPSESNPKILAVMAESV